MKWRFAYPLRKIMEWMLYTVIAIALLFDFTNGFHDAANAIATSISTRALSLNSALVLAAILNVIGGMLSTVVAITVATGIVVTSVVTLPVILAGLLGAIFWNLLTWYFGIPSSSSHCLVGGIAGAVIIDYGVTGVQWMGVLLKVAVPTFISPLLGFLAGILLTYFIKWIFRFAHPGHTNKQFKRAQLLSASFMALSHGLNDAQKTMGIITLALFVTGSIPKAAVPMWVKLACALAIGLGTFAGGKRIIRTLGMKLFKMSASDGFAAQTSAALVMQAAAWMGSPISTTHVATAAIMGVGSAYRVRAVRWGVSRNIIAAWILTLPASAFAGGLIALIFKMFGLR
jgi:inorganic phosphate transporter, PiT family